MQHWGNSLVPHEWLTAAGLEGSDAAATAHSLRPSDSPCTPSPDEPNQGRKSNGLGRNLMATVLVSPDVQGETYTSEALASIDAMAPLEPIRCGPHGIGTCHRVPAFIAVTGDEWTALCYHHAVLAIRSGHPLTPYTENDAR
jgi:hypothetical protein